ncbi:hypothetical protein SAMN05421776_12821 [Nocardia farcinica]|uniref:Uncharacterized protein n=1 Tax=Nocardia farcinica TaxID=37329 RepID=A0A0H5P9L8_NOCFR|nr:hypothetical protein [Nocardia farcinica]AXK88498.1 hypothetical protein DXT66_25380 [Nocardia farcinica]PFW98939.1 hypothetical protein CJ469_05773 [Nocardia farcinica]PFX05823.1 hypothetical protein CJ468_05197 [Nocardia farcinica]CRY84113.1 Uncharacterised protein [Nocardia farcinica]SIT34608.1 hypothetical protein SAMN05421776_12821 [Nocardia farcinica]
MNSERRQLLAELQTAIDGVLRRGDPREDLAYAVAPGSSTNRIHSPAEIKRLTADLDLVTEALDNDSSVSEEELQRLTGEYLRS